MNSLSSVEEDYGDQAYRLWVLLRQVGDITFRVREKELSEYGLSTMQYAVLFIVQAIGRQATPAEISRWLYQKPNSVSGLLSRMEKAGLVKRVKDLDRKNLVRIAITEKGQNAYRDSTKKKSVDNLVSCLSEEETQQLASCLKKLQNRGLAQLGVNYKPPPFP